MTPTPEPPNPALGVTDCATFGESDTPAPRDSAGGGLIPDQSGGAS